MTAPAQSWHARLAELGIRLPPVAAPVASYVPAVRSGQFVFTSGQLPFVDGGHVGGDRGGHRGQPDAQLRQPGVPSPRGCGRRRHAGRLR